MYTETLIGHACTRLGNTRGKLNIEMRTRFYLIEQCDVPILRRFTRLSDMSHDMKILHMRQLLIQSGEFMEMRGE